MRIVLLIGWALAGLVCVVTGLLFGACTREMVDEGVRLDASPGDPCAELVAQGCASTVEVDGGACLCACVVHTDCPIGFWCDEPADGGLVCREAP